MNGSSFYLRQPEQIADNATVTINNYTASAPLALGAAGMNETIGALVVNAIGTTGQNTAVSGGANNGQLNLSSSGTALTMSGGAITP